MYLFPEAVWDNNVRWICEEKKKLSYLAFAKRATEAVQGTHQCLNTRAVDIQSEPTGQKVQYNSQSNGPAFPSI